MTKIKVPHTLVLLFGMVVLAYFLTLVIPQGEFEKFETENHRKQVVAGSYHSVDKPKLSPEAMLTSIPKGFEKAGYIIFFVFIVGGAFGVLRATGAVDALIGVLLRKLGKKPILLIIGGILLFSAGSCTIGMAEEYLPFVPVILALCIGLGFDAVTAVGILCVGYGVGYGVAAFNPFTVLIAQGVADLPSYSGWSFRMILWAVFLALGVQHVWKYAKIVKNDPSKSLVKGIKVDTHINVHESPPMTGVHYLVLILAAGAIVVMVYGIGKWKWELDTVGAIFLLLTILWAAFARISPDKTAREFCTGATELTTTALLIGVARTIEYILNQGHVVDTIINSIAQPLASLGPHLAAVGMFFFQSICNFFIPSGSGQAFVTMPVMAPLADLVGVSRQTAVLAYQFGDGFTNILVPTNAVLVGILAMAKIPFEKWLRFILPFMIKVWIAGSIALVIAVWIGYN